MVNFVKDRNLIQDVFDYQVILVPMSINNSMNRGFKYEIGLNFPYVKNEQQKSPYGDRRKYGTIFPVECEGIVFCLCYMYSTPYIKKYETDFVQYESLEKCLKSVRDKYKNKNIASVVMGVSEFDGSGDKDKILSIYNKVFVDKDITLYDYEQVDYKTKMFREIAALHKKIKEKTVTPAEYIKERSKIEWRRRYGIFKEMPENYKYIPRQGEITK